MTYKISKPIVRSLLAYLEQCGLEPSAICDLVGVNHQKIITGEDLLSSSVYTSLLKVGAELTNDPAFGLNYGKSSETERWGVLGYIMTCCQTLGEAMHCLDRYQAVVGNMGALSVKYKTDLLRLVWETDFQPLSYQAEETVTGWVAFGRWVTNTRPSIENVYFSHPEPENTKPYRDYFNCPVRFNAQFNAVDIKPEILATHLKQPDSKMKNWLMQHAEERIEKIDEQPTFVSILKDYIKKSLPQKAPELSEAAIKMQLSPRTLQRRLEKKGISFSGVVEETRSELAMQYLADSSHSIADITFFLGFSEQSAFNRSFKRRTGISPGEYRKLQHATV